MKKKFRLHLLEDSKENAETISLDDLKIARLKKILAAKVIGGGGVFTQFSSWGKSGLGVDIKVPISGGSFSKYV